MNFKKIGLGLAATAAVTSGIALTEAPAQAVNLAPGSFQLNSTGTAVTATDLGSQINLNLSLTAFQLTPGTQTGVFAPNNLSGTPVVGNLLLNKVGGSNVGSFTASAVTNFITGLKIGTTDVVVDLAPTTFGGFFTDSNNFTFGGATTITGLIRASDGNQALATATFSALNFSNLPGQEQSTITVGTAAIPTPALLPGLVGMGVAALRKRKGEQASEAEA